MMENLIKKTEKTPEFYIQNLTVSRLLSQKSNSLLIIFFLKREISKNLLEKLSYLIKQQKNKKILILSEISPNFEFPNVFYYNLDFFADDLLKSQFLQELKAFNSVNFYILVANNGNSCIKNDYYEPSELLSINEKIFFNLEVVRSK